MNGWLLKALRKDATRIYPVLVKGNIPFIKNFIEQHQGHFKYNIGSIASVTLKGTDLVTLSKTGQVSRMEYYERTVRTLDDTSIIKNNLLKIHNGQTPLPQAYDGTGVTFGLVDTGIDWHHPDFKDSATGKTRVMWIWDQTFATASNTPQPYNYGQEWNNIKIDSGLCGHNDFTDVGHGTKVAGIAAGNGNTNAIYKGHAPKADIVCVALDFNSSGPVVLDAVHYLATKANAMGQPFVLNLSIGDYIGSHDGKDLQAQAIDSLYGNKPGRCVVAAAGNAGDQFFHLQYSLNSILDTNFTFMQLISPPQTTFPVYADTNNFKQAKFRVGVYDDGGTWRYAGSTGFKDITTMLGSSSSDTIKNQNGDRIGIVEMSAGVQAGTYELIVNVTSDTVGYYWTFEIAGPAKLDAWNMDFYTGPLPDQITLPRMMYYKKSDSLQTICTSFQCSDQVISVANYTERRGHISCQHTYWQMPGPYDTLLSYTSRGPTRDNRIKPDISATGDNILTTCELTVCKYMAVNYPATNQIITEDTMHITFSGTSSAAPSVAGFVALYLQKNPTATSMQIKNAITGCAKQDYYTGSNLPNVSWGYGKLDGFNAMTCSAGGLQKNEVAGLRVYPNPANEVLWFEGIPEGADLRVFSLLGSEIKRIDRYQKNAPLYIGNLPQGLYLYTISRGSELIGEGKFIKE